MLIEIPFFVVKAIHAKNIVQHGDDIQYLFTLKPGEMINDDFSIESKIVRRYSELVYSFAKYGYVYMVHTHYMPLRVNLHNI